jgi:hypothetical protein
MLMWILFLCDCRLQYFRPYGDPVSNSVLVMETVHASDWQYSQGVHLESRPGVMNPRPDDLFYATRVIRPIMTNKIGKT